MFILFVKLTRPNQGLSFWWEKGLGMRFQDNYDDNLVLLTGTAEREGLVVQ